MSSKIINIDIHDDIIYSVSEYIYRLNKKVLLISGGQRPFLFIKKNLSKKYNKSFFPPKFFTNDEFIEKIIFENTELTKISDFEAAFMIFEIIKNEVPTLLNGKTSFAYFMEWSFEILSFIEHLDLENVSQDKLKTIKINAEIGYDVPIGINNLLKNIFEIRKSFHNNLERASKITKGYSFLKTMLMESNLLIKDFDEVILMAPFYLYKTEIEIFKKIYKNEKLTVFIQGDPKEYDILARIYYEFCQPFPNIKNKEDSYILNIYSAFDDQSQGALLRNLISNYSDSDRDKTVVVVPNLTMLQSVLSEISIISNKYNVSAGYPAQKTAVFSLLNAVVEAQFSRKGKYYYSMDVMRVLTNPLLKNFKFFGESYISEIIIHKIEESLNQNSASCLSGKVFISFEEIINEKWLIESIVITLTKICEYISAKKIIEILEEIFNNFFILWEDIITFKNLANVLHTFLLKIYSLSSVDTLNIEAIELLLSLLNDFKFGSVSKVKFQNEDIFNIFKKLLKNKRIPLQGSPLEGLQVLGLLESRNISFDNVFVVGMTDSAIPAVKKVYSVIPKDIMYALGLEMAKKEFEIQKYHFQRLISRAKNLNLIYSENEKNERSRFIESLIWNKQLKNKNMNIVKINKFILPKFSIEDSSERRKYKKTKEIKEYLSNMFYTYSKIDTYLNCKLKFYFKYVLSFDKEIRIGYESSNSDIGSFIHNFLKDVLYENLNFEKLCTFEFEKEYFKKLNNKFDNSPYFKFREDSFIIKEVLVYRMKKILSYERMRMYKNIYACEREYTSNIKTLSGKIYNLDCRIDRIDIYNENYVILDYKTGVVADSVVSKKYFELISNDFNRKDIKKGINSLQLPLYKYIFEKKTGYNVSECGVYDIKKTRIIKFSQKQEIYDKCVNIIRIILDEINNDENFEFAKDDKTDCKNCRYFYTCR
ncbi:MAG: PD-(D/E)XK nuclease family protein [Endomicrobium sp.]|jgi:hypothetical protein|nr:PD-(D/E)XK nuclease family protein [Endomicrobium sp.]